MSPSIKTSESWDESELARLRQKNAELERQVTLLDTVLSHTPDFTYKFDLHGRFTYANRSLLNLWQMSSADAVGKTFAELAYPPDLAARLQRQIQQVIDTGFTIRAETVYTGADGRTGDYEYIFVPVFGINGRVRAVVGSTRDITVRKRGEGELRESEQRFSAAFENAAVGMVLTTPEGEFIEANQAYVDILGYSKDELRAGQYEQFTYPDDVPLTRQFVEALRSGKQSKLIVEKRFLSKEGRIVWVRATGSMRRDRDGKATQLILIIEDITTRKRAEDELQTGKERLQQVFAEAPVAICVLRGHDLVFELANPYYQRLFPGRELPGKPLQVAIPEVSNDVMKILRSVLDTGVPFSASEFCVPLDHKHQGVREDCWFDFVYNPLRDSENRIWAVVVVAVDVTSHVRGRGSMERANRELEEFAYVAGHDLQEPLRMINIYTQLLARDLQPHLDGATREFVGNVESGVRRMEKLLRDLLHFSHLLHTKPEDLEANPVADLNVSLTQALSNLESRIIDENATVTSDRLPVVYGNEILLVQVFQNLVANALKYRKVGEPAHIAITARAEGSEWVVTVRDEGIGFDQEQSERVFGLFKRLHRDEYPGTGLGLAICKRIIERNQGRIWAESSEGGGSAFHFALRKVLRS